MRRQEIVLGICAGFLVIVLAGCSSNNNNTATGSPTPTPTPTNPNPTNFKKRVLISSISPTGGGVLIADGDHDVLATQTVSVNDPDKMLTAGGQTVIRDSTRAVLSVFTNQLEEVNVSTGMQDIPFDVAITSDGKTAYGAIKNKGVVEAVDTTTGNITATVTVPSPARLVMSPNGTKLLVFSDDPQAIPAPNTNAFFVIDTATAANNPVATAITGASLDEPYTALFNASETKAFILNCGPECGGTTASVVLVDFSGSTPVFSTAIPVSGATVGLLNGSNLFVAGTPVSSPAGCPLAACGTLQVINTSALTAGNPMPITDGFHQVMAMSANNHLYIGARQCTVGVANSQNQLRGCLSIFNGTATPVFPIESSLRSNFNVTGLQQISDRTVMYVAQGGALDIFDINTDAISTSILPINVPGNAEDVLQIDP
jgi:hypothetical protein